MSKLIVLLWSFILGQVVAYIGGALSQGTYDFTKSAIVSLVCGVIVMLIAEAALPKKEKAASK
ncbi:MAG: YjzD family protein [Vagococcus sp.]|uniref:YjzD family protein n=1 Tax=Vagococcus sp. TaxID=1933889 RepID=UPI002FC9BD92